jgi:hypothetical protein
MKRLRPFCARAQPFPTDICCVRSDITRFALRYGAHDCPQFGSSVPPGAARDAQKENSGLQMIALPDTYPCQLRIFGAQSAIIGQGDSNEDQRAQSAQGHHRRGREGSHHVPHPDDIGGGVIVTASITNEAVDELKLAKGKPATAVIKASDVMVGVE